MKFILCKVFRARPTGRSSQGKREKLHLLVDFGMPPHWPISRRTEGVGLGLYNPDFDKQQRMDGYTFCDKHYILTKFFPLKDIFNMKLVCVCVCVCASSANS